MSDIYTVLIIDDHPILRRGLKQLFNSDPKFTVVADVASGLDGINFVTKSEPDLIILDLNMKELSGVETLKEFRRLRVTSKIVILTVSDAKQDMFKVLSLGIDGYLLKDEDPDTLLQRISEIMLNQHIQVISAGMQKHLDKKYTHWLSSLTPREFEILDKIALSLSNKLISNELHISEETVKVHIKNLFRKSDTKSRTELAIKYLKNN